MVQRGIPTRCVWVHVVVQLRHNSLMGAGEGRGAGREGEWTPSGDTEEI